MILPTVLRTTCIFHHPRTKVLGRTYLRSAGKRNNSPVLGQRVCRYDSVVGASDPPFTPAGLNVDHLTTVRSLAF